MVHVNETRLRQTRLHSGREDKAWLPAEKALQLAAKVPNSKTTKAMHAADRGKGKRLNSAAALFKDLGI
jgi:hypothetical protein